MRPLALTLVALALGACSSENNSLPETGPAPGYDGGADECARQPGPCDPNATCTSTAGGTLCTCNPGFFGDGRSDGQGCQPAEDCSGDGCLNGGVCTAGVAGYSCDCTGTGFAGSRCELRLLAPVVYWPFDGESHSRSSLDRAGRGNDIYRASTSVTAQPVWVQACPGASGACYRFPAGAHLEAPFHDAGRFGAASDFTLAVRISAEQPSSTAEIIHGPRYEPCDPALRPETCPSLRQTYPNRYAFRLYLQANRLRLCSWLGGDPACAAIPYPEALAGSWVQVLGWREGNALCLSLDEGAPSCATAEPAVDPAPPPGGQLFVGAHPTGVNFFAGHLDEILIFDRALAAVERADLVAGVTAVDTCEPGDLSCCGNQVCDAQESVGTCVVDCAATLWEEKFLREYFSRKTYYTVSRKNEGYAYWANSRIRPFIDMYQATQRPFYFATALEQAKAAIRLQQDVNGDGWLEWPCYDDSYGCAAGTGAKFGLCAERAARAISGLARMIVQRAELAAHLTWAKNAAANIQSTLIKNPLYSSRYDDSSYNSPDTYPLPHAPVHHIVSHAATVMYNLNEVLNGGDPSGSYYQGFRRRAQHLKDSLLPNPGGAGVAWGAIWCQALSRAPECYVGWDEVVSRSYFCADPEDASHTYCFPMDLAHSTDFVDTAVMLHDAGQIFSTADITALAATFAQVMHRQDPATAQYYFTTHVDGSEQPAPSAGQDCSGCAAAVSAWYAAGALQANVPGCIAYCSKTPASWTRGHLAPGWTALARGNGALLQILADMDDNTAGLALPWTLSLRYYAQLVLLGAPAPTSP